MYLKSLAILEKASKSPTFLNRNLHNSENVLKKPYLKMNLKNLKIFKNVPQ
jgi:hypothetical protein